MVFDLKLYERLLCGAQQELAAENWESPKGKSEITEKVVSNIVSRASPEARASYAGGTCTKPSRRTFSIPLSTNQMPRPP